MLRQTSVPFNDVQKALAAALHEAGQTDREIADACNTSVNNIIWWRNDQGLADNGAPTPAPRPAVVRHERTTAPAPVKPQPKSALLSPAAMQAAYAAPVQPDGDNAIEIGVHLDGKVFVDLEELLTTRLLIQGNSGSGKTHLLRRLLEETAGIVQQVIIDPEGDFASFGEAFGHTVIDGTKHTSGKLAQVARRTRELQGSVVLTLEGVPVDDQMSAATAFLDALFEAGPDHWHPAIVAVDEAHLFAPAGDNGEDKDTRKASQVAMANLMCRGRKRGLAGIIATQRLSKLHKNVAAEASNFLLGRTLLDIVINRATDLLGISRSDGEAIRNLSRGEFIGLGPAIAKRQIKVKVGPVITRGKTGVEKGITPLPTLRPEEMQAALLADDDADDEAPDAATVVPFTRKSA